MISTSSENPITKPTHQALETSLHLHLHLHLHAMGTRSSKVSPQVVTVGPKKKRHTRTKFVIVVPEDGMVNRLGLTQKLFFKTYYGGRFGTQCVAVCTVFHMVEVVATLAPRCVIFISTAYSNKRDRGNVFVSQSIATRDPENKEIHVIESELDSIFSYQSSLVMTGWKVPNIFHNGKLSQRKVSSCVEDGTIPTKFGPIVATCDYIPSLIHQCNKTKAEVVLVQTATDDDHIEWGIDTAILFTKAVLSCAGEVWDRADIGSFKNQKKPVVTL